MTGYQSKISYPETEILNTALLLNLLVHNGYGYLYRANSRFTLCWVICEIVLKLYINVAYWWLMLSCFCWCVRSLMIISSRIFLSLMVYADTGLSVTSANKHTYYYMKYNSNRSCFHLLLVLTSVLQRSVTLLGRWGWGGWFTIFSLAGFSPNFFTQSDLRFCKNEGPKRSKINEKGGQLDCKWRGKLIQNA